MRLIDADAIPWTDLNADMPNTKIKVLITFAEKVNRMPTIEERKTGKWIHTDTQAGYDINGDLVWADMMKCETCGFEIDVIQGHIAQYNYCPSCGAEMDF